MTKQPSKGHLYICLVGLEGPGELLGEGALTTAMAQGSWRMDEFGSILSEIAGIGERIWKEEGVKLQHLLLRPHPGCHPPQKPFSFSWEIALLLILEISVLCAAP